MVTPGTLGFTTISPTTRGGTGLPLSSAIQELNSSVGLADRANPALEIEMREVLRLRDAVALAQMTPKRLSNSRQVRAGAAAPQAMRIGIVRIVGRGGCFSRMFIAPPR